MGGTSNRMRDCSTGGSLLHLTDQVFLLLVVVVIVVHNQTEPVGRWPMYCPGAWW
jgi:hypothetical protein